MRVAYDGASALDTAETFQPEIIFMDLGMPELDGYEACRRIRASSWGMSVQMIAVSGWARPEDQQRSAAAGFDRTWSSRSIQRRLSRLRAPDLIRNPHHCFADD